MGKYSACCPNYYLPLQRLSYQEKEDGNVQQKKNYHSIGYRYLAYQLANHDDEREREYNLMREEVYRELYLSVRELPDRCREVFELHLKGKKNEEIAELLSLSVETVKTHKKNAVRFLKERMGNLFTLLVMFRVL